MQKRNVIIVGAGMAGIAAARKVCGDDRFNVKILEASDRIGGRIFTRIIDGTPIELGATYIHGTIGNVIYDLSKQHGLVSGDGHDNESDSGSDSDLDMQDVSGILSNGESIPDEVLMKCWSKFSDLLADINTSVNAPKWADLYEDFYAYLVSEYPKRLEADPYTRDVLKAPYSNSLFESFLNRQSVFEGQEYCKGVRILTDYVDLDGDPSLKFNDGCSYSNLVEKLVEELPKDTILCGKEVINISTVNDPMLIKCSNGDQFEADHVIVTVSLGVLKRRCLDESLLPNQCPLFTPALPVDKLEAVRTLGFGHIGKIILQFDQEISSKQKFEEIMMFWLPDDKADLVIKSKFPWATNVYFLDRISNTHLYQSWVHGSTLTHIENTSKEEILDGFSYILQKFLKHPVPRPVDIHMHRWSSDPLFGGSYTVDLVTANTVTSVAALERPLDKNRVLFSGESTSLPHFATVHGAYLTGVREADRLLKTV